MSETTLLARCSELSQEQAHSKSEVLVTAAWLIVGLSGCLLFGPLWIDAMRPKPGRVNDYYQDWGSARNHIAGLPVYTHHAISIPRYLGLPNNPVKSIEYNAHPPTSVLLALSLARLDYPNAVLVWNMISLAAFLGSLAIVATTLAVPRKLFLPVMTSLVFCHPLCGTLYDGQLTLILVLLVTAMWALERSGRSRSAGLLLGIAASIKLFPAYLAVYYLAQGRLRPLLVATGSFMALTLITAIMLGLNPYADYINTIIPYQSKFRSFDYNLAIAGFWHKLFDSAGENGWATPLWPSPSLACWGILLSDLAITSIVIHLVFRAQTLVQRDLCFATAVTAMLLVSPVTWDTSLPLLLIPIAFVAHSATISRSSWILITLFIITALVYSPQIMWTKLALAGRSLHTAPWTFMLGAPSLKFYALLALFSLSLAAFRGGKQAVTTVLD